MVSERTDAVPGPGITRLTFAHKSIRARIIADYLRRSGASACVCFSSGNAAYELRRCGLDVVEVGPAGDLQSRTWWKPEDIRRVWPERFDATPGHLPVFLMVRLAAAFRQSLGELPAPTYEVPTGSGETITCLRWAYPGVQFVPIFGVGRGTEREPNAPLLSIAEQTPPGD